MASRRDPGEISVHPGGIPGGSCPSPGIPISRPDPNPGGFSRPGSNPSKAIIIAEIDKDKNIKTNKNIKTPLNKKRKKIDLEKKIEIRSVKLNENQNNIKFNIYVSRYNYFRIKFNLLKINN